MRSLRKDALLIDLVFLVLLVVTFRMVAIRYEGSIRQHEMAFRQTIIDSLDDVVDSFILAETGKIRFLTPFLTKLGDADVDVSTLFGSMKSVQAIYNVDRDMRVDRILYLVHPNKRYLENVNLIPQQIKSDMKYAFEKQTAVFTKLHSSVATGKYSFSFLFPHAGGILIAEADLQNILGIVQETGLLQTYKNSIVLLINPVNGQVHFSSDPAQYPFMQFSPTAPEFTTVSGKSYYYTMQQMKVLDLMLVVLTPQQAFESFIGMMRQYLTILLISLCLLTLLRWYFVRKAFWSPLARFLQKIQKGEVAPAQNTQRYQEWDKLEQTYDEAHRNIATITATLQSTRDFLRLVIDAMPANVLVLDNKGTIVHWNQMTRQVARVADTAPPEGQALDLFPFLKGLPNGLATIQAEGKFFSARGLPVQMESMTSYYDVIYSPLNSQAFTGGVLIILDVTGEMRKDLQLQQAQKMDMIGNLSGGLAHDLNNVLGGISGAADLMGMLIEDPVFDEKQFTQYHAMVKKSVTRAAELVRQLLTLSRKQEMNLRPSSLKGIIANVVQLAERSLMKSVTLEIAYPQGDTMVLGDTARLEQVFLNLFINAAHAMTTMRPADAPQGGAICVRFALVTPSLSLRTQHPNCRDVPYWLVAVSDSGVGMPPAILQKIFDPFFTTRAAGTGLGLAMAYNIIQHHAGFIDVNSEEGHGSTFNVYLPAISPPAEGRTTNEEQTEPSLIRGEGVILVADDDDVMRTTAANFLNKCGYKVLTATNGRECVELYRQHTQTITAVLLDMVMPVLSGHDAYLQLKKLNPNVKVMLCSGFKQDQRAQNILQLGAAGFVQKPYSLYELSSAIHQMVTSPAYGKKETTA